MAAIIALAAPLSPGAAQPETLRWSEDATRDYFNHAARLRWLNRLGDWTDVQGRPQGRVGFAELRLARDATGLPYAIDVTALVRAYGADFMLLAVDGALQVYSREALAGPPILRVTRGGQTFIVAAEADTWLTPSTHRPLGTAPLVLIQWSALLRFPQPADRGIERAELILTPSKPHGPVRILVMRPSPANPVPDPPRRPRGR